jgi:aromatic ring-opening dioxygenase LigB subunit
MIPGASRGAGVSDIQLAMASLTRQLAEAAPDVLVLFTPHGLQLEGLLSIVVTARIGGGLGDSFNLPYLEAGIDVEHLGAVDFEVECDRELAVQAVRTLRSAGAATVACGFGAPDELATMPADWAILIPLWFLLQQNQGLRVVVVNTARSVSAADHVVAGEHVRAAAETLGRRLAVVASGDHGQTHRADGPFGHDLAAVEYDRLVVGALERGRLDALLEPAVEDLATEARADSWRPMLSLHGTLGIEDRWRGDVLAYVVPTYYGMLCARIDVALD